MKCFGRFLSVLFLTLVLSSLAWSQPDFWQPTYLGAPYWIGALTNNSAGTVIAANQTGGVYQSTDNGSNWLFLGLASGPDDVYFIYSLVTNTSGHIFAGVHKGVYRKISSGSPWEHVGLGTLLIYIRALVITSGGNIFSGSSENGIYRSTNNGDTWTEVNFGLTNIHVWSLARNSSNHLFAGTEDGLFRSTDNGNSWTSIFNGMTSTFVRALGVNSLGHLFAGTIGGGVFRSTNAGATWEEINTGLFHWNIWAFTFNASGHIFVATDGGVYRSMNNGNDWEQINSGLTTTDVRSLTIPTAGVSSGYIFAGTYMGGIFRSTSSTILAAPTLSSPLDNSSVMTLNLELTWNVVGGATSYQLQVATDPSFSPPFIDAFGITGNQYPVGGLTNNLTYYWRVRAFSESAVSDWSNTWSFHTVLETPTLALPMNGELGVPIAPMLRWNASAGAESYGVQISTDQNFPFTNYDASGIQTTSHQATGLAYNTLYYWRVNASNAGGTSQWSDVWNFTTMIAPPAIPSLSSPADGSTGISTNPTLSWMTANGAESYQIQVATSPTFNNPIVNESNLISTMFDPTGLTNNMWFFWRVRAWNISGFSPWSEVWSFKTAISPPAPPALELPLDNAIDVSTNPVLSWYASNGAASYQLQVALEASFTTPIIDQSSITTPYYSSSNAFSQNTTYYWRVNASNAGGTSDWSTVWRFTTTSNILLAPFLISPPDGTMGISTDPTMRWHQSIGASTYQLQISRVPDFSSTDVDLTNISDTTSIVSNLQSNTQFYWHVRASNANGTSAWSTVWTFTTTLSTLAAPTLISPPDGSTGVSTTASLIWNPSTGATSYRLQVSTDPVFGSTVFDQSWISSTSASVQGLSLNTTFYWRVNASNAASTSGWSSVWSFTTSLTPPAAPVLELPSNNAVNVPINTSLSWFASNGAASYRLHVSRQQDFSVLDIDQGNISVTSFTPLASQLANNMTYFWRVNATNSGGTSAWSNVWSFRTIIAAPLAPTLKSPSNGATGITTNPTLMWDQSNNAASYRLQVSTAPNFTTMILDESGITNTSRSLSALKNNTLFYWKVNATNAGGTSGWSSVWSFMTMTSSVDPLREKIPIQFVLNQNYPNPFSEQTTIGFQITDNRLPQLKSRSGESSMEISFRVYDLLGREVIDLTPLISEPLETNQLTLFNYQLPRTGVYFYQLQIGQHVETRAMILIK